MKKLTYFCLSCILLLGLTGCITPAPGPRSQFYQLQPIVKEVPAGEEAHDGPVVHIGPVEVSEYLNLPQMVTRVGNHQVAYSELKRWAEPLHENILWVLSQNIHDELPGVRVVPFTGLPSMFNVTTLSVPVRISRLESRPDGSVLLQAGWMVIHQKSSVGATPVSMNFTQTAASSGTEDLVAAQSELIRELSEKIVRDIQTALKEVP